MARITKFAEKIQKPISQEAHEQEVKNWKDVERYQRRKDGQLPYDQDIHDILFGDGKNPKDYGDMWEDNRDTLIPAEPIEAKKAEIPEVNDSDLISPAEVTKKRTERFKPELEKEELRDNGANDREVKAYGRFMKTAKVELTGRYNPKVNTFRTVDHETRKYLSETIIYKLSKSPEWNILMYRVDPGHNVEIPRNVDVEYMIQTIQPLPPLRDKDREIYEEKDPDHPKKH